MFDKACKTPEIRIPVDVLNPKEISIFVETSVKVEGEHAVRSTESIEVSLESVTSDFDLDVNVLLDMVESKDLSDLALIIIEKGHGPLDELVAVLQANDEVPDLIIYLAEASKRKNS